MNFTLIDRQEAPARAPERAKRRIRGMDELVASLVPGKVARIELAEGDKPLRVSDQLFKTATRQGKLVDVWEVGGILYAEVADATADQAPPG